MAPGTFGQYVREISRPITPTILGALNSATGVVSVIVFVVALANRPIAAKLANWDGISPWFAVIPAGLYVTRALLLAAFRKHQSLDSERREAEVRLDEVRRALDQQALSLGEKLAELTIK